MSDLRIEWERRSKTGDYRVQTDQGFDLIVTHMQPDPLHAIVPVSGPTTITVRDFVDGEPPSAPFSKVITE